MEEGRVCLPGIGTLLVVEQPAMVSLMEGKAAAPCARVAFNANLVVDDGRLRREVGADEAAGFVRQTRESLDAGRTVLLDGIGKLYQHQTGEVRFSPGAGNFSKETFGLPDIDVKPIVRKDKPAAAANMPTPPPVPAPNQEVVPAAPAWHQKFDGAAWYAAALVGLLLVLYLLFRLGGAIGEAFSNDEGVREERNITPRTEVPSEESPTIDANTVRPGAAPRLDDVATPTADEATTGTATENTAIIAIGLYARQRNVDKQVRRLTAAGYTPYTDNEGRNTRLGVQVRYRDEGELRQVLREVRARYTDDAFVMRVNGEERRPQ